MATEIKKPTTFTEGALLLWTEESKCYDFPSTGGDESSFGYQTLDEDESPSIRFHTWATKGQTYTQTTLKMKWKTSIQTGDDEVGVEYTKDGGSNWYDLLAKGVNRSVGYSLAEIALDANQDLTNVEVRVNSDKVKGGDGCDFQVSDIWTEGEYTSGGTTATVNLLVQKIVPYAPTIKTGTKVAVSLLVLSMVALPVTAKAGTKVSTSLLVQKIVPYAPTVKTSAVIPVNLLVQKIVPYAPTAKAGTKVSTSLLVQKIVPYSVTTKINASAQVNLLVQKIVPYAPTVKTSAVIPVNLLVQKIVPYAPTAKAGTKVSTSLLVQKITPYSVTIGIKDPVIKDTNRINRGYVYYLSSNKWSMLNNLDVAASALICGVGLQDNMNIFVNDSGDLRLYPGNILTSNDAHIRTRKIALNGRLQRVRVIFSGDLELTIKVFNRRFPAGYREHVINDLISYAWRGIPGGLKGEYIEFRLAKADEIYEIGYVVV